MRYNYDGSCYYCRILFVILGGKFYEIKNEPENIGLGGQYMQFIVERIACFTQDIHKVN